MERSWLLHEVLFDTYNLLARHFVSEDNNQVKEITMIFDDLKNISFYKGIHPNLDKAIDYLL